MNSTKIKSYFIVLLVVAQPILGNLAINEFISYQEKESNVLLLDIANGRYMDVMDAAENGYTKPINKVGISNKEELAAAHDLFKKERAETELILKNSNELQNINILIGLMSLTAFLLLALLSFDQLSAIGSLIKTNILRLSIKE